MKILQTIWKGIRWFVDAFTDTNGFACLTKLAGLACFIYGLVGKHLDFTITGLGALGTGKALDAVVPRDQKPGA